MKGRSKIIIATTIALLLTTVMMVQIMPALAKKAPPQTWRLRLPGGYDSARQLFMNMFPELSASGFHYYSPNISTQPGGSPLSMSINLASVSVKTTDKVFSQNWHLIATGVDVSVGIPGFSNIGIVCKELIADVNLHPPAADGEFGTLTANLKGEVLLRIPIMPGIPGYYYVGSELAIEWTLVEPRYTVSAPSSLEIPQGTERLAEVTVTPMETGIAGQVGLGFECEQPWGIKADFDPLPSNTPPFTATLKVHVQPDVPTGVYEAKVIVNDWTTGKSYDSGMAITVTESGFTVYVNGANPYTLLAPIQKGTSSESLLVTVEPWTDYSAGGIGLGWRPAPGDDFSDIGIELAVGGIPPPPCGPFAMTIKVGNAKTGTHVAEIWVFDGGLKREFVCPVTFDVVEPSP